VKGDNFLFFKYCSSQKRSGMERENVIS